MIFINATRRPTETWVLQQMHMNCETRQKEAFQAYMKTALFTRSFHFQGVCVWGRNHLCRIWSQSGYENFSFLGKKYDNQNYIFPITLLPRNLVSKMCWATRKYLDFHTERKRRFRTLWTSMRKSSLNSRENTAEIECLVLEHFDFIV